MTCHPPQQCSRLTLCRPTKPAAAAARCCARHASRPLRPPVGGCGPHETLGDAMRPTRETTFLRQCVRLSCTLFTPSRSHFFTLSPPAIAENDSRSRRSESRAVDMRHGAKHHADQPAQTRACRSQAALLGSDEGRVKGRAPRWFPHCFTRARNQRPLL